MNIAIIGADGAQYIADMSDDVEVHASKMPTATDGYVDLKQDLTELVGCKFHQLDELNKGKSPTEYDITKWIDKYRGTQNLPPYTVELNNFRIEVDQFVTLIMSAINRHA